MIEKDEVIALAKALDLQPQTVEKDYVLSWIIWGISQQTDIFKSWVFKGGTSLKKCFFETFRFSEDLDFTVLNSKHLDQDSLLERFNKIADSIYEQVGIEFDKSAFKFEVIPKTDGKVSVEGKVYYTGPLQRRGSKASIKLDLTNDELVVLASVQKEVHHPYSDKPESGIFANCYAFEEVVAEKIRALGQRVRPRDLYDVVHFYRNRTLIDNPDLVLNTLQQKCSYKSIEVPDFKYIENHEKVDELKSEWENMLAHQLPTLPPIESFWRELEPFFEWLGETSKEENLVPLNARDKEVFHIGRVASARSVDLVLQRIQFAAANRVCVELVYKDEVRTVEPYSFRKSKVGRRLFYGYHQEDSQIKCFGLDKIQSVKVTNIPYKPRYSVEINASGPLLMPRIRTGSRS